MARLSPETACRHGLASNPSISDFGQFHVNHLLVSVCRIDNLLQEPADFIGLLLAEGVACLQYIVRVCADLNQDLTSVAVERFNFGVYQIQLM